ncbi:MAG: hypothetical protein JRH15_17625 [Deltaproteobacteria bacterium]|nr:hypothetical protein [Deltaproteobacteria bacterium]
MLRFFKKYLLPGFVFQSTIIGGGYATGREIVEFLLPSGPTGGLLAMTVSALIWSVVSAVSFELVRLSGTYDYRTFFKGLLGKFWFTFELSYFVLLILVLAVIGAAAADISESNFGLNGTVGALLLMAAIGVIVFFGTSLVEKVLSGWSFVLYITYLILVFWLVSLHGDTILNNFKSYQIGSSWLLDGITYAGYSTVVIPAIFFCLKHIETRKEAVISGLLAGPIGIIPAIFFYVGMMAFYPEISDIAVPVNFLIQQIDAPVFNLIFQIVIFGTFIETGTAFLHTVNERVNQYYQEKNQHMPRSARPIIAIALMTLAVFGADRFGIVNLIAKGYGGLTWVFIAIFVVPVLTWGLVKIKKIGDSAPVRTLAG